jgi:hypothetical protein
MGGPRSYRAGCRLEKRRARPRSVHTSALCWMLSLPRSGRPKEQREEAITRRRSSQSTRSHKLGESEGRPCRDHERPSSQDAVPKGINPKEQRYCGAAAAVWPLADLQRKGPDGDGQARSASWRWLASRPRRSPLYAARCRRPRPLLRVRTLSASRAEQVAPSRPSRRATGSLAAIAAVPAAAQCGLFPTLVEVSADHELLDRAQNEAWNRYDVIAAQIVALPCVGHRAHDGRDVVEKLGSWRRFPGCRDQVPAGACNRRSGRLSCPSSAPRQSKCESKRGILTLKSIKRSNFNAICLTSCPRRCPPLPPQLLPRRRPLWSSFS